MLLVKWTVGELSRREESLGLATTRAILTLRPASERLLRRESLFCVEDKRSLCLLSYTRLGLGLEDSWQSNLFVLVQSELAPQ